MRFFVLASLHLSSLAIALQISNSSQSTQPAAATLTASPASSANVSLTGPLPNLWYEECDDQGEPPCAAICHPNDNVCINAGKQVLATCGPQWSSYWDIARSWNTSNPLPSGWYVSTSYYTLGTPTTVTSEIYTSFSTATDIVTKYPPAQTGPNTVTPVYALPPAITSVIVTNYGPLSTADVEWTTGPTPICRYFTVSYEDSQSDCGQCSIGGNTVQLFFWPPPATATASLPAQTNGSASLSSTPSTLTRSAVLPDGITLYSPTAYISLNTIYARDSCGPVGGNYSSTLIGIDPALLSTQYHFGGKVAASGANSYAPLNVADLTGLPPVTEYENQPSCILFGCSTIYPDYHPTLVVPQQLASLDPAWANCGAALNGLYDPPSALTAESAAASATNPFGSSAASPTTSSGSTVSFTALPASQCITPNAPTATPTSTTNAPGRQTSLQSSNQQSHSDVPPPSATAELASIIGGAQNTNAAGSSEVKSVSLTSVGLVSGSATQSTATSEGLGSYIIVGIDPTSDQGSMTSSVAAGQSNPIHQPIVSVDSNNNYVVDSETLLPGSSIVLSEGASSLTVHMLTSQGATMIALGSSTTVSLVGPQATSSAGTEQYEAAGLTFGGDGSGDLILGSSTLKAGSQITVGSAGSKTTIALASAHGSEVVIVNGKSTDAVRSIDSSRTTVQSSTASTIRSAASGTTAPGQTPIAKLGDAHAHGDSRFLGFVCAVVVTLIALLIC